MYRIKYMTKKEKIAKKFTSLKYNHLWLKYVLDYGFATFMSVLSAAIYAFGYCSFVNPNVLNNPLVSGGASGLAQTIELIFKMSNSPATVLTWVYGTAYVLINVPIIILGFKGIGKRFGAFTLVNVLCVFLFTTLFKQVPFINDFAQQLSNDAGMLARALFAGLCTGISSAIAFKSESSAGGFDVVSYYISQKKGTNTGPYIAILNGAIFTCFTILNGIHTGLPSKAIEGLFFSIVYIFTTVLLIDLINVRNKKAQVEIVTNDEKLGETLMAYIPHGATVFKGTGVYSGQEHKVIHMVVSTNEVKRVVQVVKELDPEAFINVVNLSQVYGRFHMKAIK